MNISSKLRNMGDHLKLYGTEMMQSLDSSEHKLQLTAPNFFNKLFVFLQFTSLALYTFDVGSDVWLAIDYYSTGKMLYFVQTVCWVVIPSIITSCVAYLWYKKIHFFHEPDCSRIIHGFQEIGQLGHTNRWTKSVCKTVAVIFSMFYR